MKNIYIVGVPRTGKTTLAKLIKKNFPIYNQISFEAIRNGFIKTQPNLNMDNRYSEARINILPEFILEFIKWNNIITNTPCLMEGEFINISNLHNKLKENDIIICLGHNKKNINQIIENLKKYDKPNDYTFNWNNDKIKSHFKNIETIDKFNYDYCKKNNLKYYDTSENREKIFNEILLCLKNE